MNTLWAIIIAVAFGLVVAVPFWAITMHQNKKNWAWEKTGKYLREMNRVSWCISVFMFVALGSMAFLAIVSATGGIA